MRNVYDITVGYEGCREATGEGYRRTSCPTMVEFLLTYSPKIHVNVRRVDMKDVPSEEAEISKWLYKLFSRKEM